MTLHPSIGSVRRARPVITGVLLLLAIGGAVVDAEELSSETPEVSVRRLRRAPTLEDFLNMEPPQDLRDELSPITGFIQREPEDGEPASQSTDVYLGYDDRYFYVIFVAFDDEPEKMRARLSRRENVFEDETVEIQIDTFNDQRRAYSFLTNPYGVQWDALWTEGQGFDPAWDTLWRSRGRLTDRGYVVWMAIPFKTLRFPVSDGGAQTWRIILVRDIPRNNETAFWPRVSSRIEGRLNQAATLRGVGGVTSGRNLWLIPYGTARDFRIDGDDGQTLADDLEAEAGLDAKWVFRDNLALDLTVNPDFSQVESDLPQVTVNERFEVFFPERRPFFLENADYFRTPIDLLFTRRIADPSAGARLTGKIGPYSIGVLAVDDEAPGKLVLPDDPLRGVRAVNGVFRLSRDVSRQSNIGVMITGRGLEDGDNRVAGVDARIKLDANWDARVHAVHASTRTVEGERLQDPAYSLVFNREARKLTTHLHYLDIGRDFRTELGFVPRVDIREWHGDIGYNFRPEGPKLIRWRPGLFARYITDQEGLRLDVSVDPSIDWEFRRQTTMGLAGSWGRERLRPGDAPGLSEARDYAVSAAEVFFESDFIAAVGFGVSLGRGKTINFSPAEGLSPEPADRWSSRAELTLRPSERLRIDNTFLYTRLEDRASGREILTDQILRVRFDWQFDRKLSLRVIAQNNRTGVDPTLTTETARKNWNGDLLLTYLVNPWTAFYAGYNGNFRRPLVDDGSDGSGTIVYGDGYDNDARQLFLKLSYLFRP